MVPRADKVHDLVGDLLQGPEEAAMHAPATQAVEQDVNLAVGSLCARMEWSMLSWVWPQTAT